MGLVRVRPTTPLGPHRAKQLTRVVEIDLPWFEKCLTSAWTENLKLEDEVASLQLVNATLQLTAEEAIEARKQQIEGLQQQMEGLQQQLKEKEEELRDVEAKSQSHALRVEEQERERQQQLAVVTQLVSDITSDMTQEKLKWEKLDADFQRLQAEVARHHARDNAAKALTAALQRALQAERVGVVQLRQRLEDAQEAAATAATASSTLTSELQAKIRGLERELCAASSEVEVLRQKQRQEMELAKEPSASMMDVAHQKEMHELRRQVARLQECMAASKTSLTRQYKETIAAQDEVVKVTEKLWALQAEVAQQRQRKNVAAMDASRGAEMSVSAAERAAELRQQLQALEAAPASSCAAALAAAIANTPAERVKLLEKRVRVLEEVKPIYKQLMKQAEKEKTHVQAVLAVKNSEISKLQAEVRTARASAARWHRELRAEWDAARPQQQVARPHQEATHAVSA
ncbi:hypothetical protein Vafri_11571 [Volvox africanus]|nr:hypothetical protein Vafri_11571 [Volvox africanus]GIL56146.1 hypothetical protein Vafri_11571 [Volvox africanus]GIL56147.1 hypothetical protein Vafri_11571 [Volvox africanus]GIL56148.1 hypothetical protein Vafri_11571 [Volvox africanus]GIL56149.1 hypothetical protein Vafri_11571 [Volvox africanus]